MCGTDWDYVRTGTVPEDIPNNGKNKTSNLDLTETQFISFSDLKATSPCMSPIPMNRTILSIQFFKPKHKNVLDSYSFPTTSFLTTHHVLSILSLQLVLIYILPLL